MGRHQAAPSGPSRRGVTAALVGAALLIAGGAYTIGRSTADNSSASLVQQGCTTPALRVEVPPEITTIVKTQLGRATRSNSCHRFEVASVPSSTVATRIRQGRAPDVWVADSSVWLDLAPKSAKAPWASKTSLTHTPIVLANPLRSPHRLKESFTSWDKLIDAEGPINLANPHLDTASRLAYLASEDSASPSRDVRSGQRIIVLSRFAASGTPELFSAVKDPRRSRTGRSEPFPVSEQALAAFASTTPGQLRAVLPSSGTPIMDYPWIPSPALTPEQATIAAAGQRALSSPEAAKAFARAGFRTGTGQGPTIDGDAAAAYKTLPPIPADARQQALGQWDSLKTDSRMLVIMDVSGSMERIAPDTGGKTRAQVAQRALITATKRLPAGTQASGWIFSTNLDGKGKDWRSIAPMARLDEPVGNGTHREAIIAALEKYPSYLSGDTGLYDTTEAAYAEMVKTYDPAYVNSVVIITDGKNDDPSGGLSLRQLLASIQKTADPARPVRIITIGMGEFDPDALEAISSASGGRTFEANTPDDLLTVFVEALLTRGPTPRTD